MKLVNRRIRQPPISPSYSDVMPGLRPVSLAFLALMIIGLALILSACGASTSLDSRAVVELRGADAPATLTMPCDGPVDLGGVALSAGATERAWAQDRSSLVGCAFSKAAVVDYYKRRDAGLSTK